MRKVTLFVLTSMLISTFIVSCAKDDPTPNPPEPETYDSLLVRTFTLDTTLTPPYDTIKKDWLYYDALGRISEYRGYYQSYSNSIHYESKQVKQFEYNDNSIHSTKVSFTRQDLQNGTIATSSGYTSFYTWANGKLIRDSTQYDGGAQGVYNLVTYTYEPSYITRKVRYLNSNAGSPIDGESRIFNTVSGSQVTATLDSVILAPPPPAYYSVVSKKTAIYNNHSNPYYAYSRAVKTEFIEFFGSGGMINSVASPFLFNEIHNYSRQSVVTPGLPPSTSEAHLYNDFTYRADGYPLICREKIVHGVIVTSNRKTFFFYE